MEAEFKIYWRIGAAKKIRKRYAKGWRAAHMVWDHSGERLAVLWERNDTMADPNPHPRAARPAEGGTDPRLDADYEALMRKAREFGVGDREWLNVLRYAAGRMEGSSDVGDRYAVSKIKKVIAMADNDPDDQGANS